MTIRPAMATERAEGVVDGGADAGVDVGGLHGSSVRRGAPPSSAAADHRARLPDRGARLVAPRSRVEDGQVREAVPHAARRAGRVAPRGGTGRARRVRAGHLRRGQRGGRGDRRRRDHGPDALRARRHDLAARRMGRGGPLVPDRRAQAGRRRAAVDARQRPPAPVRAGGSAGGKPVRRRGARTRHAVLGRRPDHRRRQGVGSELRRLGRLRAVPGRRGDAHRAVHGADRHRARQRPGTARSPGARRRAGGSAPGRRDRGAWRLAGERARRGRHGGVAPARPRRHHAVAVRRRRRLRRRGDPRGHRPARPRHAEAGGPRRPRPPCPRDRPPGRDRGRRRRGADLLRRQAVGRADRGRTGPAVAAPHGGTARAIRRDRGRRDRRGERAQREQAPGGRARRPAPRRRAGGARSPAGRRLRHGRGRGPSPGRRRDDADPVRGRHWPRGRSERRTRPRGAPPRLRGRHDAGPRPADGPLRARRRLHAGAGRRARRGVRPERRPSRSPSPSRTRSGAC